MQQNDIMTYITPFMTPIIQVFFTALAGILAKVLYRILDRVCAWIEGKIGSTNYNAALEVAYGLYIYLEDKYSDALGKMGDRKKQEMENLLLQRFPNLTQVELDSINKSVWSAFNESWLEESKGVKLIENEV